MLIFVDFQEIDSLGQPVVSLFVFILIKLFQGEDILLNIKWRQCYNHRLIKPSTGLEQLVWSWPPQGTALQ